MSKRVFLSLCLFAVLVSMAAMTGAAASEPPVITVGLDSYRQWQRWPYQRIGARAYMRSTYDRSGGNMDASNFLYQLRDDFNVTLDVQGPGVLYFARYNHWHGSPWHYEVDGVDHVVRETTTADPLKKLDHSVFIPEHLFPNPLTWTYSSTKGADLMWVPIGFRNRFRMAYGRTFYGTGYYIYHHYLEGMPLSQPIRTWDGRTVPDPAVLELLRRSGTDIAPQVGADGDIVRSAGRLDLPSGKLRTLAVLDRAPAMIRALKLSAPADNAVALGEASLRITWDDRSLPSVDVPLALFFGVGTFHNRDQSEYLVKAFPVNVRFADGRIWLACYLPMPFFTNARLELIGSPTATIEDIEWEIRSEPYNDPPNHVGYLHATFVDHGEPEPGEDLVFLDTAKTEGGGSWSGSFIGTSFIFSDRAVLTTLEGDPRFFFDDSRTPQAQGTGTEEWGGGGDYWGGQNMTLPFVGHPVGVRFAQEAKDPQELIQSAYRYLLADLMPFGRRAVIRFEHGAHNDSVEHYRSVTYWYGLPAASLILTDVLDVGDADSEREHRYVSPAASAPYSIESRYELGTDHEVIETMMRVLPDPDHYAEFEFEADAGRSYYVWVRGRTEGAVPFATSWFQFDDRIGTDKAAESYQGPFGFQEDWSWGGAVPMTPDNSIRFDTDGLHRLRVQGRFRSHDLHQIWLSTTQTAPPAADAVVPTPPAGDRSEILLLAADANNVNGDFQLIDDDGLAGGQFLRAASGGPRIGGEYFAAHTESGRKTSGASEFEFEVDPDNLGVMLRRTLDYQLPNQRARVLLRSGGGESAGEWEFAGTWYLAGSNTNYASFPGMTGPGDGGELGAPAPLVQTSNRRFRDDEFLLPRHLTGGQSTIRVRIEFEPVEIPLLPGHELPELGWSEIRYQAYSFVMPEFEVPR